MNFKNFKEKRGAGKSLLDKNIDLFLNDYLRKAIILIVLWALLVVEGIHFFLEDNNLFLVILFIFFAISIKFYFFDYKKWLKEVKNNNKGRMGEVYIGEFLEENLKNEDSKIINDLVLNTNGKKYNIDHILINKKGIFIIETKNWNSSSSFAKENYKKWVIQVEMNIKTLGKKINNKNIFGLVVRPGKITHKNINFKVPVVNEKYISDFINKKDDVLSSGDVDFIYKKIISLAE